MAAWKAILPLVLASALVLPLVLASALVVDAHDVEHGGIMFGYSGPTGPDKWGSLGPGFEICSKGQQQSPVNIDNKQVVHNPGLAPLERDYAPGNATLANNGFHIALQFDEKLGTLLVDGKNYVLSSMHWHIPSEHTIDGERFPAELHMVHLGGDGNLAVVAILYKFGRLDPFLAQIQKKLKELAGVSCKGDEEARVPVGVVRTGALQRESRKYYRYFGSLTTPPCTERVIWSILGRVREVTKEQVAALQAPLNPAYQNNSRPTQPLNFRTVQLYYEPKKRSKSES